MAFNSDGWRNFLTKIGFKNRDKTEHNEFAASRVLEDRELTALYIGAGLAARIIDIPAEDMTRRGFIVDGDSEGKIAAEWDRIGADRAIASAVKWARLYGGSLTVVGYADGRELDNPLGPNARGIDWIKVYPRTRVAIGSDIIVGDPSSPYFEDVEVFPVTTYRGTPIKVHRSRCLVLKGIEIPRDAAATASVDTQFWGVSALQPIWDELSNFGMIEKGVANIMQEFIIGVYGLSNLAEMLSTPEGESLVYSRMDIIQASKSILNAVLLSDGETFERNVASVAGVADIIDRYMIMLAAVSGIPVTRLFQRSPAGQNATGEADLRTYYDRIGSEQTSWLRPAIRPLIDGIASYVKIADPHIKFEPLYQPTDSEMVETRHKQAQTDKIYADMGALDSDEIRDQRFAGGYSYEMSVEVTSE